MQGKVSRTDLAFVYESFESSISCNAEGLTHYRFLKGSFRKITLVDCGGGLEQ